MTLAAAAVMPDQSTQNEVVELAFLAARINREHADGIEARRTATHLAKAVGQLLLEVKELLPHGQFLPWVAENTTVSARQCQRYMRAALGKKAEPKGVEAKSDTVSHFGIETIKQSVAEMVKQAPEQMRGDLADFLIELAAEMRGATTTERGA